MVRMIWEGVEVWCLNKKRKPLWLPCFSLVSFLFSKSVLFAHLSHICTRFWIMDVAEALISANSGY